MRENDAMASIGVGIGNRGSSRVSATSEEDQAYSGPRLKTLD